MITDFKEELFEILTHAYLAVLLVVSFLHLQEMELLVVLLQEVVVHNVVLVFGTNTIHSYHITTCSTDNTNFWFVEIMFSYEKGFFSPLWRYTFSFDDDDLETTSTTYYSGCMYVLAAKNNDNNRFALLVAIGWMALIFDAMHAEMMILSCLSACLPPLFSFRTRLVASYRDFGIAAARGHAVATYRTTVVPVGTWMASPGTRKRPCGGPFAIPGGAG
jgi:hypothetical protein